MDVPISNKNKVVMVKATLKNGKKYKFRMVITGKETEERLVQLATSVIKNSMLPSPSKMTIDPLPEEE